MYVTSSVDTLNRHNSPFITK